MKIIRSKKPVESFYGYYQGTTGNHTTQRRNISLMRERKIEAMVDMARNILFDRYEDVVSRENVNKK